VEAAFQHLPMTTISLDRCPSGTIEQLSARPARGETPRYAR
jgi:hypothetical protein